jgi:enamine deaminase RidA (YjgF/YER057c/UK114 family)
VGASIDPMQRFRTSANNVSHAVRRLVGTTSHSGHRPVAAWELGQADAQTTVVGLVGNISEAARPFRGRRHQRYESMKRVVHTGLPEFGRPTEHAVMADGHLRTTAVPLKMDGTFETGDARSQIALALENLEKTVKAAGGEITDVIQALCFLTNASRAGAQRGMDQAIQAALPQPRHLDRGLPGIVILIQVHLHRAIKPRRKRAIASARSAKAQ